MEPAQVWAQNPRTFLALANLYGAIDRKSSPIDPILRSLITVRISQLNWCAFCVDLNSMTLIKRAGSEEKVDKLTNWKTEECFSDKEKVSLAYAEAITLSDQNPNESHFSALRQFFSDQAIIDLTALIAFQNMSSKFNSALDIGPQGFCKHGKN